MISIPTLAERPGDAALLAKAFLNRFAREMNPQVKGFAPDALAALDTHQWPGNVRELRNVVERTVILSPRDKMQVIEPDMLPGEITEGGAKGGIGMSSLMGVPLREAREEFEREYLTIQIRRFSGNISKTASFIGMERSALHRKLKILGMTDRKDED